MSPVPVLYRFMTASVLPVIRSVVCYLFYRPLFKRFGRRSVIIKPLKFTNPQHIEIGEGVSAFHKTWLLTLPVSGMAPRLVIDDGATIGHFNHITCVSSVYIGKNVLTADKVYISDNLHGYENIHVPIAVQPVRAKADVSIGDETWIGENVCVIGARIGRHCVIGANSVVTRDVPDFSVAAGIPARVIKQYSSKTDKWERKENG